jgi:hypothetical protein
MVAFEDEIRYIDLERHRRLQQRGAPHPQDFDNANGWWCPSEEDTARFRWFVGRLVRRRAYPFDNQMWLREGQDPCPLYLHRHPEDRVTSRLALALPIHEPHPLPAATLVSTDPAPSGQGNPPSASTDSDPLGVPLPGDIMDVEQGSTGTQPGPLTTQDDEMANGDKPDVTVPSPEPQ